MDLEAVLLFNMITTAAFLFNTIALFLDTHGLIFESSTNCQKEMKHVDAGWPRGKSIPTGYGPKVGSKQD